MTHNDMTAARAAIDAEIAKGRCPLCHCVPVLGWVRGAAGYDICTECAEDEDYDWVWDGVSDADDEDYDWSTTG